MRLRSPTSNSDSRTAPAVKYVCRIGYPDDGRSRVTTPAISAMSGVLSKNIPAFVNQELKVHIISLTSAILLVSHSRTETTTVSILYLGDWKTSISCRD